jgi:two-component system phosphate regulon response regulator PhoB
MERKGPILVVEDEEDIRRLVIHQLEREGWTARGAADGAEAIDFAKTTPPILVVLDMMLPGLPGTEVCRRLRAQPETRDVPIIILSARGEEIDRVVGFEVGADDYVVKSQFSPREFVLRIRAILRRTEGREETVEEPAPSSERQAFGTLELDLEGHRTFVDGEEITLTATEFKLLRTLAARPGRVQSRGTLLEDVWDMPPDINTRTVDTHVKRLREKLGSASSLLETVRGVGYRFHPPARK